MLKKTLPSTVTNIYVSGRYKLQKQSAKYKIPIRNTCKLFIIYTVSSFCWLYLISYSQKKEKFNQKHFAPPFSFFQEIVISNFPLFQQNCTSYTKETAENIILKKQTNSFSESYNDSALPEIPRFLKGCQKKLNTEQSKGLSVLFREISIQNYIGRLKTTNGAYRQYGTKGTEVRSKGGTFQPSTATILEPYLTQSKNKNNSGTKQDPELLFFARKPVFTLQLKMTENVTNKWQLGGYKKRLYGVNPSATRVTTTSATCGINPSTAWVQPQVKHGLQPQVKHGLDKEKLTDLPSDQLFFPNSNYEGRNIVTSPEFDLLPRRLDKVNKKTISNKKIKVERVPRYTISYFNFKPKLGQTEQLQLCNYSNIDKLIDFGFPPTYTPKETVSLPFASFPGQTGIGPKDVLTSCTKVKLVQQEKTNSDHICRTFSLYNPLLVNRAASCTDVIIDSRLQSGFNFPDAPIFNKNSTFLKKENIYSKKKILFLNSINYTSPISSFSSFNNCTRKKGLSKVKPLPRKDVLSKVALPPVHLSSSQPGANYNVPNVANRGYFSLQWSPVKENNRRPVVGKLGTQPYLQSALPAISGSPTYTPFLELVYKQKPVQGYMSYDQTRGYVHINKKSPAINDFSKENSVRGFPKVACTFRALTPTGDLRSHSYGRETELWDLTAQNLFGSNLQSTGDIFSSKPEQPLMLTRSRSERDNLNATVDKSTLSDANFTDKFFSTQKQVFKSSSSATCPKWGRLSTYFVPVQRLIQKTQSLVGFNKILSFPDSGKIGRAKKLPTRPSRTYPFITLNNNADIQTVHNNFKKNNNISQYRTSQQGHVPESFFGTPYLQLGERFTIEHLKGKNQMGLMLNVHTGDIFTPDAVSYSTSLGSGTICGPNYNEQARLPVFPFASTGTSFTTVFGKKRLTKLRSKKTQSPVTNGRLVSQWSSTNIPYSKIETALKETRTNLLANKEIPGPGLNSLPSHSSVEFVGQPTVEFNNKGSLRSLLYFKRISGKANRHIINPFKYYNPGTKRDRNIEDTLLTLEGYKKSRLFAQTHPYYGGITVPFLPIEFLQNYPLSTIHDLALWDPHLQSILGGMRQRTESQRIAQNVTGAPPINNEELKKNKSQNSSCSSPNPSENMGYTTSATWVTEELLQDRDFLGSLEQVLGNRSPGQQGSDAGQHLRESPEQNTDSGYSNSLVAKPENSHIFQGYNKENKKKRYRSTNSYPLRTLLAVRSQNSLSQIPIQPTDRTQYIYGIPTSMVRNSLWLDPPSNTLNSKGTKTEPLYSKPKTHVIKGSGKTKGFYFENLFSPVIRVQNERMCFLDQPQQKHTSLLGQNNYNENLKWVLRQPLVGAWRHLPISFRFSKILFFIVVWSSYKILAQGLLNPSGAARLSQSTQFLPAAFTEAVGLQTFQQKYRIITAKKTTQSFKNLAGAEKTLSELRDLIWTFHLVGTGGPRGEHSPFAPLPYIGGQAGQKRTSVLSKARNRFLLVGPPGTGKTLLVKTLAAEANVPVIVQPASQLRMIAGVENPVSALFRVARQIKPCIIFLDELDTLGNNIHTSATETTAEQKLGIRLARKYTYTLLLELDGLTSSTRDLLIIGATNRPETLNPALTRAGRFDTFINCNLPSQEQRFAVLSLYLSNQNQKGEKYKTSIFLPADKTRSKKNLLLSSPKEGRHVFTSSRNPSYTRGSNPSYTWVQPGIKHGFQPGVKHVVEPMYNLGYKLGLTFGKADNNPVKPKKANQTILPVLRKDSKKIEHFYTNYIAQKCYGLSQASIGAVVNQSALESMLNFNSPALHTLKTLERAIESVKLLTPESNNRTVYQQAPLWSVSSSATKKLTFSHWAEGRGLQFFVYKAYQTLSSSVFSHLTQLAHPFSGSNFSFSRSKEKTVINLTINPRSTHPTDKHDLEEKILKGYAQQASINLYSATRPQNLKFSEVFGLGHKNIESNLLILKQLVLTSVNKTALTQKQKSLFADGTTTGASLFKQATESITGIKTNRNTLLPGSLCELSTTVPYTCLTEGRQRQNKNQQNISSHLLEPTTLTSPQTREQSDITARSTSLSKRSSEKTMQKPVREVIRHSDPLITGWFRLYLSRPIVRYDNLSYIENKEYYPQNNYILRRCFTKTLYSRNISTLAHSPLNFEKNKTSIRDQRYHGIAGKRKQGKFVSNKIWEETISNKSVMGYSTPFDDYFNQQIQPIFLTIVAYFFHKMCVIFKDNRELVDYCVYSKLRYNAIYEFSVTQICKKF